MKSLDGRMTDWFEVSFGEPAGKLCHVVLLIGIFALSMPLMLVGAALDRAFLPGE